MASVDNGNENGAARWLGVTVETWVRWLQTFGVSTALVCFMCVIAWKYIPPVVDGHLRLLESTSQTLQKMDETLRQSTTVLQEIVEVQRQTKMFFEGVTREHNKMAADLETIKSKIGVMDSVPKK